MSYDMIDTVAPINFRVLGSYFINTNGFGTIRVNPAPSNTTFTAEFHIPKTTTASKGYQLNGVMLNYRVVSGAPGTNSVVLSLRRISVDNSVSPVAPSNTNLLNTGLTTTLSFTPAIAGTYNTNTFLLNAPAYDNTANIVNRYEISVTLTNSSTTTPVVYEFNSATMLYTQNVV